MNFCFVKHKLFLFQVVNTVTSNHECVSNIADSQVLASLLLLLYSLPSSKRISFFTMLH